MTRTPTYRFARILSAVLIVAHPLDCLHRAGSTVVAQILPSVLRPVGFAEAVNPPLKEIGDGVFEIGKVRFNKSNRTITIPASVNMDQGLIEYVLVHSTGKVHESLLRTEAEPSHIHVAALLLSDTKAGDAASSEKSVKSEASRKQNVSVWIASSKHGKEARVRAEDFVFNLQSKQSMTPGPWSYVGSRVIDGTFLAQRDGSIVAIIDDQDALINNPRPGSENDEIWQVKSANLPPVGSSVEVTIQMKGQKRPQEADQK